MRILRFGIVCLALTSSAINVLQGIRIRSLEKQIEAGASAVASSVGASLAEFQARDLAGHPASIRFGVGSKPTLVYVFRPSCVWCYRNSDAFNSLIRHVAGKYDVVGLSLDSDRLVPYIKRSNFNFPVYSDPDATTLARYQLGVTPETLLISSHGTIVQDWRGAYTGDNRSSVERFFGVHLPGLVNIGPEAAALL